MARFKAGEEDHFGGQGGTGFFGIAKNHEVKRIRFLYNTIEDVQGDSVHKVTVNGKDRYVNCLRDYNDPVDVCPFCAEKKFVQAKLFIPVYNIDEKALQLWDRGRTMFGKMATLCNRYASNGDTLVSHIFEVERNGEPKDTKTTYEIFEIEQDDTTLDDFDEIPQALGGLVLDKTAEDMEYYLETGEFPPEEEDDVPVRRSSRASEKADEKPARRERDAAPTTRRTPAGRGRREAF